MNQTTVVNNRSLKSWVEKNDIEMYSMHNEEKSVAAERFIRTLKKKTYKYMTSISKNIYIDELDDIVDKYHNTYHITIKMKPVHVKSNKYINVMIKIQSVRLVIVLEYQNINIFLQKVTLQFGLRKF